MDVVMNLTTNRDIKSEFDMKDPQSESDFGFECRLCLKKPQLCYSIFEENVVHIIEILTSVKLSEDDELPSTCCSECLQELHSADNLRIRIIESDRILRNNIPTSKTETGTTATSSTPSCTYKKHAVSPFPAFNDSEQSLDMKPYVELECIEIINITSPQHSFTLKNNKNEISKTYDKHSERKRKCNKTIKTGKPGHSFASTGRIDVKKSSNILDGCKAQNDTSDVPEVTVDVSKLINRELNNALKKKAKTKQKVKQDQQPSSKPVVHIRSVLSRYKNDDLFNCYECGEKVKDRSNFIAHLQKHDLTTCKECGQHITQLGPRSVSNYLRHMDTHYSGPQVCELCGAVAKNNESLRGHMFYMHKSSKTKYKCEECNLFFKYKYRYGLHMQKHNGNRTHMCDMCGKGFYTKHAVYKHIQMKHLKMRPHICEYCKKGYSSRYALRTHVRQHTNETPYICHICSDGFRQKVSLNTHLRSKHAIKNYEESVKGNHRSVQSIKNEET